MTKGRCSHGLDRRSILHALHSEHHFGVGLAENASWMLSYWMRGKSI